MLFRQVVKTFHCLNLNPTWDASQWHNIWKLNHHWYTSHINLDSSTPFNQLGIWINTLRLSRKGSEGKFTPLHSPICHSIGILMHHKHNPNPSHLLALSITSSQHFPFLIYNWNKNKNLTTSFKKVLKYPPQASIFFCDKFLPFGDFLKHIYILSLCHIWLQLAILW